MFRPAQVPLSATTLRFSLPPQRRLRPPSRLPTLVPVRVSLWSRVLAFLEPAPARERRERRELAVVLPLRRAA